MKYNKELSNEEYFHNFKCCKNCGNWLVDYSIQGDYAYNGCLHWKNQGLQFLTSWAIFCDGYKGNRVCEGPFHKVELSGDKLVRVHENKEVE